MKINKAALLTVSFFLLSCGLIFAEDTVQQDPETQAASPAAQVQEEPAAQVSTTGQEVVVPQNTATVLPPSESEIQWVWGEVVSVDPAAKSLTLKYLDYETDQEKEVTIGANEKTTFENVKTIDEIKAKDTLSIDYTVADGKNTAKNISLEKPELPVEPQEAPVESASTETASVPAPAADSTPAPDAPSTVQQ